MLPTGGAQSPCRSDPDVREYAGSDAAPGAPLVGVVPAAAGEHAGVAAAEAPAAIGGSGAGQPSCGLCGLGASSATVLEQHLAGRKHAKRLASLSQHDGAGEQPCAKATR